MKIEKLDENQLKITLDKNDLQSRNIDARSFMYNTPESQDLFWDVIKEAESRFGFSVEESMIYVEAHMNPSGTFTIIVTKQNSSTPNSVTNKPKNRLGSYKLKRKPSNTSLDNSIYMFSSLESLCAYSRITKPADIGNNSLYSYDNKYYLLIDKVNNSSIIEYAQKASIEDIGFSRIKEYGDLLYSKNAIEQIKQLL